MARTLPVRTTRLAWRKSLRFAICDLPISMCAAISVQLSMAAWNARSTASWRVKSLLSFARGTGRCLSNSAMYCSNFCKRCLILLTFSFILLLHDVPHILLPIALQVGA